MRPAPSGASVAVVVAGAAVELVRAGPPVEAVIALFAMAAVLAAAHQADVPAGTSPAAVAAVAGLAEVVARAADAVGVDRARYADVVAATAYAAVAVTALRVAGVSLAAADQLVRAAAEIGGERHRQLCQHLYLVVGRTGPNFDRADPGKLAAGRAVAADESTSRADRGHRAGHRQLSAGDAEVQMGAAGGTLDLDRALRRRRRGERQGQRRRRGE